MQQKKIRRLTTTRMIAFGFIGGILIGTILLSLPIAAKDKLPTPFIDALFTATTSICVTGLTTITPAEHWSVFGQVVILFLIQFGGLGVVTFTTTILLVLGKRITLWDRLLIQDAYNLDTLRGLVKLTKKIIISTLLVEGAGAFLYGFQFIPEYGPVKGIWYSVFHSVSAFCNAGIDLVGDSSFVVYRDNVLINITTMMLIILGGLGFPVWWDLLRNTKEAIKNRFSPINFFRRLSVHSKLVISATVVLIVLGTVLTLIFEYTNPDTIGNLSVGNKIQASLFQSVTTRTAGFATIPQQNFRESTSVFYLIWMFIGGSPSGTAGGVKTVTVMILIISVISIIRGKKDISIFHRKITDQQLKKTLAVIFVSGVVMFTGTILLLASQKCEFLDAIYEVVSAIGTVGLSRNFTGSLETIGKLVIITVMYLGRIGPITMALALNAKKYTGKKSLPEGKILVG